MQNNIKETEFNQFMEETWKIVESNPDFQEIFVGVQNGNKFNRLIFMSNLYRYWKEDKVEWFLNNEVIRHNAGKQV